MGTNSCKLSKVELNEADLTALISATKMTRSEIIKWHKGFMADCPSGRLTKDELVKIYEQLFTSGRAKRFCDLVFKVFDKKNTNTIGFEEFLITCSLTSRLGKNNRRASFKSIETNEFLNHESLQRIIDGIKLLYDGAPLNKRQQSEEQPES